MLAAYWPWDGELVSVTEGTRVLSECVRNPLAHAFGMTSLDHKGSPIAFLKDSLTAKRIAEHGFGVPTEPSVDDGDAARSFCMAPTAASASK